MKKYFSFFRMLLIAGLQYRTAALAGLSTQLVWGCMEILLYRAFWQECPERFPMGQEALSSYIWLQQALLSVFALWYWEQDLIASVRDGTVAYELTRPVNLYGMWMARRLAMRLSRAALRCWPILLVSVLIPSPYGLRIRIGLPAFLLFLISLGLMLAVVCGFVLAAYALSFHLVDTNGFRVLSVAAADLLGGGVVPLPFLPEPLRTIASVSPFGSMQNVPLRIFGGDLVGSDAIRAVELQAVWAVTLIGLGIFLTRSGIRKAEIAGG